MGVLQHSDLLSDLLQKLLTYSAGSAGCAGGAGCTGWTGGAGGAGVATHGDASRCTEAIMLKTSQL